MFAVKAVAETRNTGRDLIELDTLLAAVCEPSVASLQHKHPENIPLFTTYISAVLDVKKKNCSSARCGVSKAENYQLQKSTFKGEIDRKQMGG